MVSSDLDRGKHSVYRLEYHLILFLHASSQPLTSEMSLLLHERFRHLGAPYQIDILNWKTHGNHIEVQFKTTPKTLLTRFINAYKSASSRIVKTRFNLSSSRFWTESYCLTTSPLQETTRLALAKSHC